MVGKSVSADKTVEVISIERERLRQRGQRELDALKTRVQELERVVSQAKLRRRVDAPDQLVIDVAKDDCSCPAKLFSVYEQQGIVVCRTCEAVWSPVAALLALAKDVSRLSAQATWARTERDKLHAEVEELKRQKANLRAGVRRAGGTPIESWQIPRKP